MNQSAPKDLMFALGLSTLACLGFGAPQSSSIGRVRWLAGCWEATNAQHTVYEQWTAPRGGAMLATARTIRRDSLIEYEFVVLRQRGDQLAYEAHPSGQSPTTFISASITDSAVTFENLKHDFPQRVGYNRRGADSLVAWISGPRGGTTRRIEFHYKRAACE